jgi:hypothetical protein
MQKFLDNIGRNDPIWIAGAARAEEIDTGGTCCQFGDGRSSRAFQQSSALA